MSKMERIMREAYENQYALGAFNCYNYETIKAVVELAEELEQPAIVAFGAKYLTNMDFHEVRAVVDGLIRDRDVDIALHLDHCSDLDLIYRAISSGFDSVMYDGSHLPFEENLENTRRAVEVAHASGVTVEAELGSIETGEDSHEGREGERTQYTDPKLAERFVEETQVDFLAVSIGTVHGNYTGEPNIRIDILREIDSLTQIPLVLHGGSGTPEDKLRESIANGISKINVNTEISNNTVEKTRDLLEEEAPHLSVLSLKQLDFIKEVISRYMRLFK